MKRKILFMVFTVVFMFSMIGCSSNNSTEESQDSTQETISPDVNATRTVTDVKGEVEIPANPERIVDLSGNSDILSILGFDVIGTANSDAYDYTAFPSYLENTLKDAKILGYSMQDTMDVEAIIALEPDLIIISTYQEKLYDQLKSIAPTVMIQLAQIDWREDIQTVATLMDREEEAANWLATYDEKALSVGNQLKETYGEDTSYLAFLASGGSFFVFDGAAFGSLLYNDLGLAKPEGMPEQENISLPVVTYEGLAQIDADVIFCIATEEDKATLLSNSIWNNMPAVANGKVVELPSSPYFNQGYSCIGRMVLLDEIAELLSGIES